MSLCRTAAPILKYSKPLLHNPYLFLPGTVNVQVRYAARKGYREKANRVKKLAKAVSVKVNKEFKISGKTVKWEKTVDPSKPDPPADDVIIAKNFKHFKYSLSEAVKLHREYHHPTVYNNPEAPVQLRIEIDMTGKSKTQFIKPFSDVARIPHPFVISFKKEVLVFCDPEDVSLANSCGASVAGGEEIVKKVKEGLIQPSLFDYVIAHPSVLPLLTPIRTILKTQMPRAKDGTLTKDLKEAIDKFLNGIPYSCTQLGGANDVGFINCTVGLIDMELDHLEENTKALIADIEKNKPKREGEFITWIWCLSPPSPEMFALDLSKYTKSGIDDDDDDDEEDDEEKEGKVKLTLR